MNNIDIMGLAPMSAGMNGLNWTVIDTDGNVVEHKDDLCDNHVYVDNGTWDGTEEGLKSLKQIGWEMPGFSGYQKGHPCYYLASKTTTTSNNNTPIATGSTQLMYGNQIVNIIIDSNIEAICHYYFGKGIPALLGPNTAYLFLINSDFAKQYAENIAGKQQGTGTFLINMEGDMFHIGRTTVGYFIGQGFVIYSFGLNDSFSDPFFLWETEYPTMDGKGPNRELLGTPYDYIPAVILKPF